MHLADQSGPRIRIEETWVQAAVDTPKSDASERTIELSAEIAPELFEHRGRSAYNGDDERVFCSPTRGTPFDVVRYAKTLRLALERAGIHEWMRPFHDWRHTSITNGAAAGENGAAFAEARGALRLEDHPALYRFGRGRVPEDTQKRSRRLWSETSTNKRYQVGEEGRFDVAVDVLRGKPEIADLQEERSGTGVEPA